MIREIDESSDLYRPSPFWADLTRKAMSQLELYGLSNFKRTVNMKYFNWNALTIVAHQLHPMIGHWLKNPRWDIFSGRFDYRPSKDLSAEKYRTFNPFSAWIYKVYLCLLNNFVESTDRLRLLDQISEPTFGNPYLVQYRGKTISQDLANSVHEFYSSTEGAGDLSKIKEVVELGAGYGRLAYVFLKALPRCNYTIVDIPAALFVSQEYLSHVFKGEKIFHFRPFTSFDQVKEEFESCRIRFISANQIKLLPAKYADMFLNISSLHEMTLKQISNYLGEVDRLCHGVFYSKQWRRSISTINGFVITEHEYPIPANWKQIYHRRHPIQRLFFEASYRTDQKV